MSKKNKGGNTGNNNNSKNNSNSSSRDPAPRQTGEKQNTQSQNERGAKGC